MAACKVGVEVPNVPVRRARTSSIIWKQSESGSPLLNQPFSESPLAATSGLMDLSKELVGTLSCHGNSFEQRINQDCGSIEYPFGDPHQALFCVLDGHGPQGSELAQSAMLTLHTLIFEDNRLQRPGVAPSTLQDPAIILQDAFSEANKMLSLDAELDSTHSGCTALVMLMYDDEAWIANAGDCRAVLGRRRIGDGVLNPVPLNEAHVLSNESECCRMLSAGHEVQDSQVHVTVGSEESRKCTRSLGDFCFKDMAPDGMICEPTVSSYKFSQEDQFVVLASDGLWDVICDEEVCSAVERSQTASEACKMLIQLARVAWHERDPDYCDDITVTVVILPCMPTQLNSLPEDEDVLPNVQPNSTAPATPGSPQARRSILIVDPLPINTVDSFLEGQADDPNPPCAHSLIEIMPVDKSSGSDTEERSFTIQATSSFAPKRPRAMSLPPRMRRMGSYGQAALLPMGPPRSATRAQSCYMSPAQKETNVYDLDEEGEDDWCSPLPGGPEGAADEVSNVDDQCLDVWMSGMAVDTVEVGDDDDGELDDWMSGM